MVLDPMSPARIYIYTIKLQHSLFFAYLNRGNLFDNSNKEILRNILV